MKISPIGAWARDGGIEILAGGRRWFLEKSGDLEELWEAMGEEDNPDERIPYWTELWPSSLALAQLLCDREDEIRGRLCLDLGCGLGFTALIGQILGARVIASDYEPEALGYCRKNAIRNAIPPPLCLAMDWRTPALRPHSLFRVWAGDIIYEKRFIEPVANFLKLVLQADGLAWIAEPGRGIFPAFLDKAGERGFCARKIFESKVPEPHQDASLVTVGIWELRRKAGLNESGPSQEGNLEADSSGPERRIAANKHCASR